MLRQTFQRMSRPRQILCRDRRKLCRDTKFRVRNGRQENFITTETNIVATEVEKNDKKIVTTRKWMLRHNNELKADISVATKENYVMTIKVIESKISITTEKFYVVKEN